MADHDRPSGPSSSRSWPGSRSRPATSAARTARQPPVTTPGKVAWLLIYPDTYEIGLPNQGLQILYEILNERADAVAERTYAPWTDLEALLRARRPAAVLGRHPPPGRRLRPPGLQPLGRARLHEPPQLHRPGRRARAGRPTGGPSDPLVGAGGHCTYNPEPLADFVDFVVLGDGEEVVGEITEVVGGVEGRPADGRGLAGARARARWPRSRASTSRRCTTSPTTAPALAGGRRRATPTCPSGSRSARSPTSASGRTRKRQLVPLTEVVHDRLNVEVFRGCTRGCRFCQAGMITRPVRERPADQVRTMVAARACAAPATTRSPSRRCRPPTSAASRTVVGRHGRRPARTAARSRCRCRRLRVDAFTVGIAAQIQRGPPHRPHLRPRGRHLAHAPGHQQADPRGGPLRRRRRRPTRRAGGG